MQTLILETLDDEFTCGHGKGPPVGTHFWPTHAPTIFLDLAYFAFRCEFTALPSGLDPYSFTYAQARHLWGALWRLHHVASQRPELHPAFDKAIRDKDALEFAHHYSLPTVPSVQWWQVAGDTCRFWASRAPAHRL